VAVPAARLALEDGHGRASDPLPGAGASSTGVTMALPARAGDAVTEPGRPAGLRYGVAVAVAAVAVAGLAAGGLAAAGVLAAPTGPSSGGPAVTTSGSSAGRSMYVQVPAFHGQRYDAVARWLRGHGLTSKIAWDDNSGLPAGTVVSVSPHGQVPAGGTVTLTIAWTSSAPPPAGVSPGEPGTRAGLGASPAGSPAAGSGSGRPGAGTAPGAGTGTAHGTGRSTTTPTATTPATSAPTPGSHASVTPTPSPSCSLPLGPVCF
jgi:hypothetical protein